MQDGLLGLLLTIIASLATVLGAFIVVINKNKSKENIVLVLGLATGIMLMLSLRELLPEAFELLKESTNLLYGTLLTFAFAFIGYLMVHFIDEKMHHDENHSLNHVGLITTIAVSMHKLPEGIALYMTTFLDIKLGIAMAFAIALHHIPEGMMIAMPVYYATNNKLKALKYAFISSLALPFGAIITMLFLHNFVNDFILGILYAIAVGMFAFIITNELIPTAISFKKPQKFISMLLVGITIMLILHLFI